MLPLAALTFLFQSQSFDIVIRHARIVDGSGNPWYQADIGTKGDTIAAIGVLENSPAKLTIDASGLTAAPGFIDRKSVV